MHDNSVFIFDMYNSMIYPAHDTAARDRIDCDVPLTSTCREQEYLREMTSRLPGFLDSIAQTAPIALAIYNAGTDVFVEDPLGALNLTADGITRRDEFVVQALRDCAIPTLMLLSGGYCQTGGPCGETNTEACPLFVGRRPTAIHGGCGRGNGTWEPCRLCEYASGIPAPWIRHRACG